MGSQVRGKYSRHTGLRSRSGCPTDLSHHCGGRSRPRCMQRCRFPLGVFTSVDWSVGSYPKAAIMGSKTIVLSVGNRSTVARYAAKLIAFLLLAAVCSYFGRRRLPPSCVPTAFFRRPTKRQRCGYAQLQERAPPWVVLIWNRAHLAMLHCSTEPRS